MKLSVSIDGIEGLTNKLTKLVEVTAKAQTVVRKNGGQMQESTQRYAPVDTGHLKREVSLNLTDGNLTAVVESRAIASNGHNYAFYQEFGTRYQPGTPHVGPAFHDQKPIFITDMKNILKE